MSEPDQKHRRPFTIVLRFDYTGNMEIKDAVIALAAIAHESRLTVYRLLVQTGPEGLPAGQLAEKTGIPPSSLSFHLKELVHAGLLKSRQEGRFVIYEARFESMAGLLSYLTDNCCRGEPCAATSAVICPMPQPSDSGDPAPRLASVPAKPRPCF